MAEYITNGQSNYGWSLTWDAAGRYPIIAKRRFATLADAQAFVDDISATATATEGLIISVIKDSVAKNNGVYYVHSVAMAEGETGVLVKVGGTETETAENYSAAVALSQTLVVGQLIKVENVEKIGDDTYQKGFYIVEAPGLISALATSTGSDDEIGALKSRVNAIEGDYVTEKELEDAVKGIVIPEVPVKDVKYGEDSLLDENGVANLSDFAKASELEAYVPTEGYVAYSKTEKSKLDGIAEGAQVNVIEKVQVNGVDLAVADADKAVNIDLTNYVTKDGNKVLSDENYTAEEKNKLAGVAVGAEVNYVKSVGDNLDVDDNGKLTVDLSSKVNLEGYVAYSDAEKTKLENIEEGAEVNYVKSVGDNLSVDDEGKLTVSIPEVEVPFQSVAENDKVLTLNDGVLSSALSYTREDVEGVDSLVLKGINDEVIGSVPVADFVADGMLDSVTPVEGTNKFLFTFKTGNGTTESFEVDFSKFVDVYHADNTTLELDSTSNTFKVKENVFDAYGAAEAAKTAAKGYADELNNAMDERVAALEDIKHEEFAKAADVYTKDEVNDAIQVVNDALTAHTDADIHVTAEQKTNWTSAFEWGNHAEAGYAMNSDLEALANRVGVNEGNISDILETLATKASVDSLNELASKVYTKEEADEKFLTGIIIDEKLNSTSTNAIQNKAVFAEIEAVRDEISNVVAGDLSDALKAYTKTADVNTVNGLALYTDGGAQNIVVEGGKAVSVETNADSNTISLEAKVSADANNVLEMKEDGLFVNAIMIDGDDVEQFA